MCEDGTLGQRDLARSTTAKLWGPPARVVPFAKRIVAALGKPAGARSGEQVGEGLAKTLSWLWGFPDTGGNANTRRAFAFNACSTREFLILLSIAYE